MTNFNQPPVYAPSEAEITHAHYRHVFENLVLPCMLDLACDDVTEFRQQGIDKLDNFLDRWAPESRWVDVWETREDFEREWLNKLQHPHHGICTGQAWQCARCEAEDLFGVASTATWSSNDA